jgi:nitric oxide dioxygenase
LSGVVAKSAEAFTDIAQYTWYETATGSAAEGVVVRTGLVDLSEVPIPANAQVFMCGPLPFMRGIRQSLVSRGVDPANVAYEIFGPDLWNVH